MARRRIVHKASYRANSDKDLFELICPNVAYMCVELLSKDPISCTNIEELAKAAHEKGQLLIVDNSLATQLIVNPLRFGCDVSFERAPAPHEKLYTVYSYQELPPSQIAEPLGPSQSADVWRKRSDTALAFAQYLRCHPATDEIRYPGLKSDPSFSFAAQSLQGGFGPVVSVKRRSSSSWYTLTVHDETLRDLITLWEKTN